MKTLYTLPENRDFFNVYAKLIRTLAIAGVLAQVISFGTELGGINTAVLQSLEVLHLGTWATIIAASVALLTAFTIEIGLRLSFPKAIDTIIYNRWDGLHLPMSIFIWLLAIVLLSTSIVLSFKNSKVIVDNYTPESEQVTTAVADSIRTTTLSEISTIYQSDSTLTAANYAGKTETTVTAYDSRLKAKRAELTTLEAKERRTGRSYTTAKDRVKQSLANLEAEKAERLAKLQRGLADKIQALNGLRRTREQQVATAYTANVEEVKATNKQAEADRQNTINSYGGGLGWFTIICQFLFISSVVLDRIQRKGSGIEEVVQPGEYDFRPGWLSEGWSALIDRWRYTIHSKIKAFADETPAAPKPVNPGAVYDLAEAMEQVVFKLQLRSETEEEDRVVYLDVKEPIPENPTKQRIGYKHYDSEDNNTKSSVHTHEDSCAVKDTPIITGLADAKQRLSMYKKRLGSHQQKALNQEKRSGKVCKRTADAITNNQQWVAHYEQVVNELKKGKQ